MTKWTAAIIAGAMVAGIQANEFQIAQQDRDANFQSAELPFIYYLTTASSLPGDRPSVAAALKFVIASSSQQEQVERCIPVQITETLYRIDFRDLKWDANKANKVFLKNPYNRVSKRASLVTPANWFIQFVADSTRSDAYLELLYGSVINRDESMKRWGLNSSPAHVIANIESQSGVSVSRNRWLLNFDNSLRTDGWGTLDFFKVNKKTDPLANLTYPSQWREHAVHDGEEWIVGMPKFSASSFQRGRLQAYGLFSGDGTAVAEAPGRLVRDSTNFRGSGVITNFANCVMCHRRGLNPPAVNGLKAYLNTGAALYGKNKKTTEEIERLLQPVKRLIELANEDYEAGVRMVCGLEPEGLAIALRTAIESYDSDVTLDQAARELYTTADELRLAISAYPATNPRQTLLAHDVAIPRETWEEIYTETAEMLIAWRSKGEPK